MQHWGRSRQGKFRFFCPVCKKTATPQRDDVERRRDLEELKEWLLGKESLSQIAAESKITRQALWKRFRHVMELAGKEPKLPDMIKTRILIVDGTYIHSHTLCALVAIDEDDKLYWKFAPYESYRAWREFLSSFAEPEMIVMDGQKGLFSAAKTLWPKVAIQRCQFHVIAFAMQYIGQRPKEEIGKGLKEILYSLKEAKTLEKRDQWISSYLGWEKQYELFLSAKDGGGKFLRPRLRSARLVIRRALPYLFTFLDYSSSANTTNLVEGWVNSAIAEVLRWHRGIRMHEKKALATTVLSALRRRKKSTPSIIERLHRERKIRRARFFMKRNKKQKISSTDDKIQLPLIPDV